MIDFPLPLLGFAAWSGTGKTTLLSHLIPLLKAKGLRIGLVKHAHHRFDIDYPGKDSYELRKAGATEIIIASRERIASVLETPVKQEEPSLRDALSMIHTEQLDLVLVEGFKMEAIPKIELHRKTLNKPYLYPMDDHIIALAEDSTTASSNESDLQHSIVCLDLNQPEEIAIFIEKWLQDTDDVGCINQSG